jgi:WD40 repeat protein
LAAAGDSIRLYDLATCAEQLCIPRKQATGLVFTDDGKTLTGAVRGVIDRWDTATGKSLTPEGADSLVEQILVSPDGSRVVTRGQDGDAHLWDGTRGQHLRSINVAWQRDLAMSPDGRYLVWPVAEPAVKYTDPQHPNMTFEGSRIHMYDIAGDQPVDRFPACKGDGHDLTFTSDGKLLVTVDRRGGMVRIWKVETGKEERTFRLVPEGGKQPASHQVGRTTLSGDGKSLAVVYQPIRYVLGGPGTVVVGVWNVATGKEQRVIIGQVDSLLDMALSPDGRWLATAEEKRFFVWDVTTGRRAAVLPNGLPMSTSAVAFSGDGRFLAVALPEGTIQLWEVATWTKRNALQGHRARPTALTFAPGWQLLSGSLDTTVLAWDLRPPRPAVKASLDAAWTDLANPESAVAFKAEGSFLAAAQGAVKLFAARIKPVEAIDARRVERWLAELGSDDFAVRDAASQGLQGQDEQVRPYLTLALKGAASLEVRRRLEQLLEKLEARVLTADQLRQLRAVLVLERIGDDDAKKLLGQWAGGPRVRVSHRKQPQRWSGCKPRQHAAARSAMP